MLPWQPEFQLNQPKDLMQPITRLVMLHVKFDQNLSTGFRDAYYFESVERRRRIIALLMPCVTLWLI